MLLVDYLDDLGDVDLLIEECFEDLVELFETGSVELKHAGNVFHLHLKGYDGEFLSDIEPHELMEGYYADLVELLETMSVEFIHLDGSARVLWLEQTEI